jgi:hypothetical protein
MAWVSAAAAVHLARAFGLVPERVLEDAEALARWNSPWDDFLSHLRRRYPAWDVGKAASYLRALRDATTPRNPTHR